MTETTVYPRYRWLVLANAALAYIALCTLMCFPSVLPDIAKTLDISIAVANDFLFIPLILSAVSLIFVGTFTDRHGIMPSLFLAFLLTGLPAFLMPWLGKGYWSVLILRALIGVSAGFAFCVMSPIIGIWFPLKEKGLAAGIMGACVSIGTMGVVFAPIISEAVGGWEKMTAWMSLPSGIGLVVTIIAWVKQPEPPAQQHPQEMDESGYKRALGMPLTWIGVFTTFFAAWVTMSVFNLVPAYLGAEVPVGIGFGTVTAGKLMMAVMLAGIAGPIVGGLMQDHLFGGNSKPVMLVGFVLCAIFIYLITLSPVYTNMPLLIVSLVLIGAGFQFVYALIPVYVARVYALSIAAKMQGLWMGAGMFGGALGVGFARLVLSQTGRYYGVILLTAVAGAVGIVLVSMLKSLKTDDVSSSSV